MQWLVCSATTDIARIADIDANESQFTVKAHASEITDIAVHASDNKTVVATSGRDRVIQIFEETNNAWELAQTLEEHVGAVTGLLLSSDRGRLISSSSDRTIVIREAVLPDGESDSTTTFVIVRTIQLKATPTSILLSSDDENYLLVSTIDRHISQYDIRSGQLCSTFKCVDSEGADAVVVSSMVYVPVTGGMPAIACVSSTDKSIRLYSEHGSLLARDYGHTEGVSGIALVEEQAKTGSPNKALITVAVDGTIFVWAPSSSEQPITDSLQLEANTNVAEENKDARDLVASRPPLRKMISSGEVMRLRRSPENPSTPAQKGPISPLLHRVGSRESLEQPRTPKLGPSPLRLRDKSRPGRSSRPSHSGFINRSPSLTRSPQDSRARRPGAATGAGTGTRRSSLDVGGRYRHPVTGALDESSNINASTEQMSRQLRTFRKKLVSCADTLGVDKARELERELGLTARALGERASRTRGISETAMVNLLDQYSEKVVAMLDERVGARLKTSHTRHQSLPEGGAAEEATVPARPRTSG